MVAVSTSSVVMRPDGREVTVTGLGSLTLMGAWGHLFWLRTPEIALRVQCGVVGTIDAFETSSGIDSQHVGSVVAPAGYTVDIRESDDGAMTTFLASWRHWELSAAIAGSNVPSDIALKLLSHFEFVDTSEGLIANPVPGLNASVEVVATANSVEGVCGLNVHAASAAAHELPLGTGKRVAGGELWSHVDRDDAGAVSNRVFVLSGRSSVVDIMHTDSTVDEARELAERLTITIRD